MTVQDLIDLLEQVEPEAEVRIAMQPRWPLEYEIGSVSVVEDAADEPFDGQDGESKAVVYITEGNQIGYAPEGAFDRGNYVN